MLLYLYTSVSDVMLLYIVHYTSPVTKTVGGRTSVIDVKLLYIVHASMSDVFY